MARLYVGMGKSVGYARKRARVCYFKTARYFAISLSRYAIGRVVLHVCDEIAILRNPREWVVKFTDVGSTIHS